MKKLKRVRTTPLQRLERLIAVRAVRWANHDKDDAVGYLVAEMELIVAASAYEVAIGTRETTGFDGLIDHAMADALSGRSRKPAQGVLDLIPSSPLRHGLRIVRSGIVQ